MVESVGKAGAKNRDINNCMAKEENLQSVIDGERNALTRE